VLSGRDLCDELVTRPEESYRLWCVVVCDLEHLVNEEAMAHWGGLSRQKQTNPIDCNALFVFFEKLHKKIVSLGTAFNKAFTFSILSTTS